MKNQSLDIIIPCYNPRKGWAGHVRDSYYGYVKNSSAVKPGLIIVNDGSTQNVEKEDVDFLRKEIPGVIWIEYSTNQGKGYALRKGVVASESDYVIITDIDFPYKIESMQAIQSKLLEEGGVVIGNRNLNYYRQVPFFRRVLSKAFRWTLVNILGLKQEDSQCGLKGFDRKGKEIFLQTQINRYLFDLEFLMLANKTLKISEVPVALKENVVFTTMGTKILFAEFFNFIKILAKRYR